MGVHNYTVSMTSIAGHHINIEQNGNCLLMLEVYVTLCNEQNITRDHKLS